MGRDRERETERERERESVSELALPFLGLCGFIGCTSRLQQRVSGALLKGYVDIT